MRISAPEKLFYKIRDVSRLTGIPHYVLRYWEKEFSFLRPRKGRGGQRIYEKHDMEMIWKIKRALYEEGYTITGARKKLGRKTRSAGDLFLTIERVKKELQSILETIKK